jgi:hypothetical protein
LIPIQTRHGAKAPWRVLHPGIVPLSQHPQLQIRGEQEQQTTTATTAKGTRITRITENAKT